MGLLKVKRRCGRGGYCKTRFKEIIYMDKGKAVPLQAWTGPEGSRRLRLPDF
jgi:hypothetical protein